jgi:hypothetical protein
MEGTFTCCSALSVVCPYGIRRLAILITAFCKSWLDQNFMTYSVWIKIKKITNETILKNAYIKTTASLSLKIYFHEIKLYPFLAIRRAGIKSQAACRKAPE